MSDRDDEVLGVGLGLRTELADALLERQPPEVRWLEIHPENYVQRGGRFQLNLERARDRWPIVPHGLTLSFGALERFDPGYVREVKRLLDRIEAPWYSDHLCFAGAGGVFLHDLLPLPFTMESVRTVAARLRELEDALERPVAVENVSYYADPPPKNMDEPDFLLEVLAASGGKLLLDVNNVYVNARNHGFDPRPYIDRIPAERVVQIHVAGHHEKDVGVIIDTHGEPVCEGVYDLLAYTLERLGPVPVLLERDQNLPPLDDLLDEVRRLSELHARSVARFEARRAPSTEGLAR